MAETFKSEKSAHRAAVRANKFRLLRGFRGEWAVRKNDAGRYELRLYQGALDAAADGATLAV